MLKRIETIADMLQWAKEVNSGIHMTNHNKCDYQDTYARSSRTLLDELITSKEAAPHLSLIMCSIYNTMAYEEVEHMLKVRAAHKVKVQMEAEYTELDRRLSDLNARENTFKASMKPYHKRLADLRRRNEYLERSFTQIQTQEANAVENMRAAKREAYEYRAKAEKYDAIRELLQ